MTRQHIPSSFYVICVLLAIPAVSASEWQNTMSPTDGTQEIDNYFDSTISNFWRYPDQDVPDNHSLLSISSWDEQSHFTQPRSITPSIGLGSVNDNNNLPPPNPTQLPFGFPTLLSPYNGMHYVGDDNWLVMPFQIEPSPKPSLVILPPLKNTASPPIQVPLQLKKRPKTETEDQKPFTCNVCEKKFKYKKQRDTHLKKDHAGTREFSCGTCYQQFSSNTAKQKHVQEIHAQFQCNHCKPPCIFSQKNSLMTHIRRNHPKKQIGQHACDYCDDKFRTSIGKRMHLKSHKKMGEIKICIYCLKDYGSPNDLTAHFNQVHKHEVKRYRCLEPRCSYRGTTNSNRNSHIRKQHRQPLCNGGSRKST